MKGRHGNDDLKKAQQDLESALGFPLSEVGAAATPEETAGLAAVLMVLPRYTAPRPSALDTDRLLTVLTSHVSAGDDVALPRTRARARFRQTMAAFPLTASSGWSWLQAVRPQLRVFSPAFWLASALVLLAGSFLLYRPDGDLVPLMLLSPLLAALGVAYAFRNTDRSTFELEATSALPMETITLARLTLVVAYNLLVGLVVLAGTALTISGINLGMLAVSWLATLLFWSGLALFASVRWGPWIGMGLATGLWALELVARFTWPGLFFLGVAQTGLDLGVRVLLLILGAGAIFLAARMKPVRGSEGVA